MAAAISRDAARNFLRAFALVIRGLLDAEIVEAIACREGLVLMSDLMLQHFKLASDNVNVIRGTKEEELVTHGHIVTKINTIVV